MQPDLFKTAGELTAFCMHVAARSLAAIGHAVTLGARVPVLHFFDGFRTSHEITKVNTQDDDTLRALLPAGALQAHRARALDPERAVIRGTSQNPDTFFQRREAIEPFYAVFPGLLDDTLDRFAELTVRRARLFDYAGHPQGERVVVLMGSGAQCAHETAGCLAARGERVGVIKVRLFRPFSVEHLLRALRSGRPGVHTGHGEGGVRRPGPGAAGSPVHGRHARRRVAQLAGLRPGLRPRT